MLHHGQFLLWELFCFLLIGILFSFPWFKHLSVVNTTRLNTSQHTAITREYNIDALRFFLATFVLFSHNECVYFLFTMGNWTHNNPYNYFLGQFGVSIFFIISGYLFYGKISEKTQWINFYIKRIFRIFPIAYLSSILCILIAIYIGYKQSNHFGINELQNIFYWFDGSIINYRPGIAGYNDSNFINAGVTWTLAWEWKLYFFLPLITYLTIKGKKPLLIFSILAMAIFIYSKYKFNTASYIALFCIGGLIFESKNVINFKINKQILNIGATAAFILCLFFGKNHNPYSHNILFFYAVFFFCIAHGADLFGLLRIQGFIRLGDASYSIYLLHGIFWFVLFKIMYHFDIQNLWVRYGLQTFTFIIICIACSLVYKYYEYPMMNLGRKLGKKFTH